MTDELDTLKKELEEERRKQEEAERKQKEAIEKAAKEAEEKIRKEYEQKQKDQAEKERQENLEKELQKLKEEKDKELQEMKEKLDSLSQSKQVQPPKEQPTSNPNIKDEINKLTPEQLLQLEENAARAFLGEKWDKDN